MPLKSRKIVGNLEPRRLGADEDVLRRPNGRIVDQSPHGDVNVRSVPNDGEHQGATEFAVGVVAALFAVDQEVGDTTDELELGTSNTVENGMSGCAPGEMPERYASRTFRYK